MREIQQRIINLLTSVIHEVIRNGLNLHWFVCTFTADFIFTINEHGKWTSCNTELQGSRTTDVFAQLLAIIVPPFAHRPARWQHHTNPLSSKLRQHRTPQKSYCNSSERNTNVADNPSPTLSRVLLVASSWLSVYRTFGKKTLYCSGEKPWT